MGEITAHAAALKSLPELDGALGSAFDAVISPDLWPQTTEALAAALGGLAVCFHQFGGRSSRFQAPMSSRYRDMLTDFIGGGWGAHDLRAKRGWPKMRAGRDILVEDDMSSADERARLPIYNELFGAHDAELLSGVALRPEGQLWSLNLFRSARMGPGDAKDLARLKLAQPCLTRLLVLAETLSLAASRGALTALEHSATPAILLDGFGQVAELNGCAQAIMGRGLNVKNRRLVADQTRAQAALDALVAASICGDISRAGVGSGPVCLPRGSGSALLLEAVPCRGRMADAFGRPGALIVVTDPDRATEPSTRLLRELYKLTPREADVAALIGAGHDIGEASRRLGLRSSSVRQIVKMILLKTGLSRQAELALLTARLPRAP